MPRAIHVFIIGWALLSAPLALSAQSEPSAAAADEEAEIQVEGQSKPKRASVAQFREAQQAFFKFRPKLAPTAALVYRIVPAEKSGVTPANIGSVRLSLVSKSQRIAIDVDTQGLFILPDLNTISDDYRLFANVGKAPIFIVPHIFSPGTSPTERRLGDIRLQCQTGWAYYKSEISLVLRAGFGIVGGCGSKRIGLYLRHPRPLASATVSDGGKSIALPLNPRFPNSYRPPIYDKSLSNEARISAVFK